MLESKGSMTQHERAFVESYIKDTMTLLPNQNFISVVQLFNIAMKELELNRINAKGTLSQRDGEVISSLTTAKNKELIALGLDAKSMRQNRKSEMGESIWEIIEKGAFNEEHQVGSVAKARDMVALSTAKGIPQDNSDKREKYLRTAKTND